MLRTKPVCCQREAVFKEGSGGKQGIRSAFCEYSCHIAHRHLRLCAFIDPVFNSILVIIHVLFMYAVNYFVFH